ncbi:MAG: hypothetical protein IJD10_01925 [Clostridia bacterium]|nr:hypothetical protein [Clostridia bacterium]
MDFWNEFSKTVTTAADQTKKGAERLTDIAKLKYRASMLRNKLEECYRDIGRLRFKEYCGEEITAETYDGLLTRTADLKEQIRDCESRLFDLQDFVACENCGYRMKKGLNFCPKCGEKLAEKEPTAKG